MSSVYKSAFCDLYGSVSFGGGGGGGGSSGGSRGRRDRRAATAERNRQRQAEIDAGQRRGLSTQERNDNLKAGALTAGATAITGVGAPKSLAAGGIVAGGGMIIDSFD